MNKVWTVTKRIGQDSYIVSCHATHQGAIDRVYAEMDIIPSPRAYWKEIERGHWWSYVDAPWSLRITELTVLQ